MEPSVDFRYLGTLQDDFLRCIGQCFQGGDQDQQFWRRTAFEKWFNYLEGWLAIHQRDVIPAMLEVRGEQILRHYGLLDQQAEGRPVKPARDFLGVMKRLVFELLFLSARTPDQYVALVSSPGWEGLRFAKTIRNRLAHPTCNWEPTIERRELEALIGSYDWFTEFLNQVDYSGVELQFASEREVVTPCE